MSDYVPKDGDLSLFENDKEGNENRPDLTGYAWIDGEKMRVSVWEKNSGKLRYSGRIEEPYNGAGQSSSTSRSASTEVPF
jgi:hypothetical protein